MHLIHRRIAQLIIQFNLGWGTDTDEGLFTTFSIYSRFPKTLINHYRIPRRTVFHKLEVSGTSLSIICCWVALSLRKIRDTTSELSFQDEEQMQTESSPYTHHGGGIYWMANCDSFQLVRCTYYPSELSSLRHSWFRELDTERENELLISICRCVDSCQLHGGLFGYL